MAMEMATPGDCDALLQAVSAVARVVRPLYGPSRLRKLVALSCDERSADAGRAIFSSDAYVVASALQSHSAASALLQQALDAQRHNVGTGCATLVSLLGVLADATLELRRQGFPVSTLREALTRTETAKRMRVPLREALPDFSTLPRRRQLEALGRLLATDAPVTHEGSSSLATALAVDVACSIEACRFQDPESSVPDLVTSHVLLGGASVGASSVLHGLLLPLEPAHHHNLLARLASPLEASSVVVIAGDVDRTTFEADPSVQVAFVHGQVSARTVDACASHGAVLCVPVAAYHALQQLAVLSGAEIVECWDELLPSAVGHERLQLQALDMRARETQDADADDVASLFLQVSQPQQRWQTHVTLVLRGPTRSLALELHHETMRVLWRLRNALRSGHVVPGNGGFWCVCAGAVALDAAQERELAPSTLLGQALEHLAMPLRHLAVLLLENAAPSDACGQQSSFFSRLAHVRAVEQRFTRGIGDVGAAKFFSSYDFHGAEYGLLRLPALGEPEHEDGRRFHADEPHALRSAVGRAFRVLHVLLSVDRYRIN